MKKVCLLILCLMLSLCSIFAVACDNSTTKEPIDLEISKKQCSLIVGQEETLTTNYTGSEIILWESSASDIATVDNGKVVATGKGTATISATVESQTATCTVIVKEIETELINIKFRDSRIEVGTGEEYTVEYEVTYDGLAVSNATVSFSCMENENVDISEAGKITGKKYGIATCLAKVVYCGKEKQISFNVLVKSSATLKVENASFEIYAITQLDGEPYENTKTLTATVTESGNVVSSPSITWSSDDESVCVVSDSGVVTGVGAGKTLVKARYTAQDGANLESSVIVTVLRAEKQIDMEAVDVDKNIGYEMNKTTLFGDSDIEFTNVYLTDGKYNVDLSVEGNNVNFENVSLSGETSLCFETETILYKLSIVVWSLTIDSIEDFRELKNASFGWYKLGANIDLTEEQWSYSTNDSIFAGVLDGKEYTISNFTIDRGNGIFAKLGNGAIIKNLNIENAMIKEDQNLVGVLATKTNDGANVFVENVSLRLRNFGTRTGGFIGEQAANSVLDVKDSFVHSYNSKGGTENGAIVGVSNGSCAFSDTKVYANTKLCSEEDSIINLSRHAINEIENVHVSPTAYEENLILFDKEIAFDVVGDVSQVLFFGETIKELTFSSGKINLEEGELNNFAGENVEVFIKLADGSVVYYVIHVASEVEIDQSSAEYIFKLSSGNIKLTEDIDLSAVSGTPIPFTGTFDGQGYTISGITTKVNYGGLWQTLSGATVKNLKLVVQRLNPNTGVLAYRNDYNGNPVTIENVYVVVESVSPDTVYNFQGGLFRQVSTTYLNLKDVVIDILENDIKSVAFIGMCCGNGLTLTDKNIHFIGGSGKICSESDNLILPSGYFKDENSLVVGANVYQNKAEFNAIKMELGFNEIMMKMLNGAQGNELIDEFNPDWL